MERDKKHELSSRYQRQSKIELDQLCVSTTVPHARPQDLREELTRNTRCCLRQTHRQHSHSGKQPLQEVGRSTDREC